MTNGERDSSFIPRPTFLEGQPRPGERQVVWTLWLTYGAFYFCRTNIAAAVPGMEASAASGGLGLDGTQVGAILAALKITYGIGQFVNGQLSERLSPRRLLAFGMLGSAGLNVLFGFSTGFYFLLFVWACNGYCQSLGWTPCVRVAGNWIPVLRRGKAIGIIGTGYQVTLGLTYFIAGQSAESLGWRAALYVPAAFLAAAALIMLLFLEEAPDDHQTLTPSPSPTGRGDAGEGSASDPTGSNRIENEDPSASILENLLLTLSNPALWLLGLSLGLLNACRYGFLDWGISHLVEVQSSGVGAAALKDVQSSGVGEAALKYVVLAVGAIAGSYLAGWATDRFFNSRRAPVICILLVLLGIATLMYESVARTNPTATVVLLAIIGFCIYGPQVLLVGTAPADLAHRQTSAAAAGFVDFLGYMGAAGGDMITGHFKMPEHGGWHVAIYIWAGWAFLAALLAALLWNAGGDERRVES